MGVRLGHHVRAPRCRSRIPPFDGHQILPSPLSRLSVMRLNGEVSFGDRQPARGAALSAQRRKAVRRKCQRRFFRSIGQVVSDRPGVSGRCGRSSRPHRPQRCCEQTCHRCQGFARGISGIKQSLLGEPHGPATIDGLISRRLRDEGGRRQPTGGRPGWRMREFQVGRTGGRMAAGAAIHSRCVPRVDSVMPGRMTRRNAVASRDTAFIGGIRTGFRRNRRLRRRRGLRQVRAA